VVQELAAPTLAYGRANDAIVCSGSLEGAANAVSINLIVAKGLDKFMSGD